MPFNKMQGWNAHTCYAQCKTRYMDGSTSALSPRSLLLVLPVSPVYPFP